MNSNNKKEKANNQPNPSDAEEVARGKKAIEAGQQANGKDARDPDTVSKENKDAEHWRNEG